MEDTKALETKEISIDELVVAVQKFAPEFADVWHEYPNFVAVDVAGLQFSIGDVNRCDEEQFGWNDFPTGELCGSIGWRFDTAEDVAQEFWKQVIVELITERKGK
jgi:hypothetical protein